EQQHRQQQRDGQFAEEWGQADLPVDGGAAGAGGQASCACVAGWTRNCSTRRSSAWVTWNNRWPATVSSPMTGRCPNSAVIRPPMVSNSSSGKSVPVSWLKSSIGVSALASQPDSSGSLCISTGGS